MSCPETCVSFPERKKEEIRKEPKLVYKRPERKIEIIHRIIWIETTTDKQNYKEQFSRLGLVNKTIGVFRFVRFSLSLFLSPHSWFPFRPWTKLKNGGQLRDIAFSDATTVKSRRRFGSDGDGCIIKRNGQRFFSFLLRELFSRLSSLFLFYFPHFSLPSPPLPTFHFNGE